MRVGRQAAAVHLLAEFVQLILGDTSFQKCPRVNAGGRVALDENHVAAVFLARRMPEMVEADVVERCRGGEAGDVPAELAGLPVGLHHHGERVPADERADAPFDGRIAGGVFFTGLRDGIEIGGVGRVGEIRAFPSRLVDEHLEQVVRPLDAVALNDRVERLDPLLCFFAIDVGNLG